MMYCRTKQKHTSLTHDQPQAHHAIECYATTQCFSQHGWHCGQWVCEARKKGLNFKSTASHCQCSTQTLLLSQLFTISLSTQHTNFVNITLFYKRTVVIKKIAQCVLESCTGWVSPHGLRVLAFAGRVREPHCFACGCEVVRVELAAGQGGCGCGAGASREILCAGN